MFADKKKIGYRQRPDLFLPVGIRKNSSCIRLFVIAAELGENGRILLRESGTEPVIRVMVEAGSTEECEKYVDQVIDVIRAKGHIISE